MTRGKSPLSASPTIGGTKICHPKIRAALRRKNPSATTPARTFGFVSAVSRTIQGIIAGVGFLGGGAILKAKDSDDVRGLTTAATIWVVAALGVSCGGGYWKAALLGLGLALIALTLGRPVENVVRWFVHRHSRATSPPPKPDED